MYTIFHGNSFENLIGCNFVEKSFASYPSLKGKHYAVVFYQYLFLELKLLGMASGIVKEFMSRRSCSEFGGISKERYIMSYYIEWKHYLMINASNWREKKLLLTQQIQKSFCRIITLGHILQKQLQKLFLSWIGTFFRMRLIEFVSYSIDSFRLPEIIKDFFCE